MKHFLLTAILALTALAAQSQTLLVGADASKKLPANFSLGIGLEYRTHQWFKNTDQWNAEISASYKPLKPLKIGLGYKFMQTRSQAGATKKGKEYPAYWNNKHRISIGLTGEWKPVSGLALSLRERYQYTYRPSFLIPFKNVSDGNRTIDSKSKHILRSRLQAEYKPFKKCRFTPFASFELYTLLSDVNHTEHTSAHAKFADKYRATAGCEFKINKQNNISLFYRFTDNTDPDEDDSPHTIGLTYSFKL